MSTQDPDRLKDFVAQCILTIERDGEAALERLLESNPVFALSARKQLAALARSGLLSRQQSLPDWIAGYRVLRRIGEGGMGSVLLAEQRDELHREVAIKLIRSGLDSREVLVRFALERQALATLDHPNIAKILDAGETDDGRPFMVMEYVAGKPITNYCDEQRLSLAGRIELLVRVCDAVQHAHHKGIIHRDLKPSNVLVVDREGHPWPMIIDFGVAKSVGGRLVDHTLATAAGRVLGTPEYMSPEQASSSVDIDTRTDVFSLGVMLYELLTGSLPIDSAQLRQAGADEMLRVLRDVATSDVVTPAPSRRVTTATQEAARQRLTEVSKLRRALAGDLDWITLRALERDRSRRYGMPGELAADLRRHLASEPVLAGPPSTAYRLRKFLARNSLLVASAVVVFLALAVGLGISVSAYQRVKTSAKQSDDDFEQAIGSVERLVFFAGERLAQEPHMDGVRRQMLVDALQFYERIAANRSDTRSLALRVANAHGRVGRIHGILGDEEASLLASEEAYRRLLAMVSDVVPADDVQIAMATVDLQRGRALNSLGRSAEAERVLSAAVARDQSSCAEGTMTVEHLRLYLQILGALAVVVEGHDTAAASDLLGEANRLSASWRRVESPEPAAMRDRACALLLAIQRAQLQVRRGELEAVRSRLAELLAQYDHAFAVSDPAQRQDLVEAGMELGKLVWRLGRPSEASGVLSQAAGELRQHLVEHPAQVIARRRLGLVLHALADVQFSQHEHAGASSTQAEAVDVLAALVQRSPSVSNRVLLAFSLFNHARIMNGPRAFGGEVDSRLVLLLSRGMDLLSALPIEKRQERPIRVAFANALALRGECCQKDQGDLPSAIEDLEQAVDEMTQLLALSPGLTDVRRHWLQHTNTLMGVCSAHGDDARALALADQVEREAPAVVAEFSDTLQLRWFQTPVRYVRMRAHANAGDLHALVRQTQLPPTTEHDWVGHRKRIEILLRFLALHPEHAERDAAAVEGRRLVLQARGYAEKLAQSDSMLGLMTARVDELLVRVEQQTGNVHAACAAAAAAFSGHALAQGVRNNERNRGRLLGASRVWLDVLWQRRNGPELLAAIEQSVAAFQGCPEELWHLAGWCAGACKDLGADARGADAVLRGAICILSSWDAMAETERRALRDAPLLEPLRGRPTFDAWLRELN